MAETVRVSNMPESGTPARVAYDLWVALNAVLPQERDAKKRIEMNLNLYAECLNAAHGQAHDTSKIY